MSETPSNQVRAMSSEGIRSLLSLGLSEGAAATSVSHRMDDLKNALAGASKATLRQVIKDLGQSVLGDGTGPLSFERLTEIAEPARDSLCGKSFLEVLKTPPANLRAIKALARFGSIMTDPRFPEATRLGGLLIETLATKAIESLPTKDGPRTADSGALLQGLHDAAS